MGDVGERVHAMNTPRDEELVTVNVELSKAELAWIRKQQKARAGALGSKYVAHQGLKERTRRLRRRES